MRPRDGRPWALLLAVVVSACAEPAAEGSDDDAITDVTIPRTDACDDVRSWPRARREREAELYAAIAAAREDGGRCPDGRHFARTPAPAPTGALVCAARNLAAYLAQTDAVGHGEGDGETVVDRLAAVGFDTLLATELVAAGDVPAARVLDEVWLSSTPHCHALRASAWTDVGVAQIEDAAPSIDPDDADATSPTAYWVVVLAATPP